MVFAMSIYLAFQSQTQIARHKPRRVTALELGVELAFECLFHGCEDEQVPGAEMGMHALRLDSGEVR